MTSAVPNRRTTSKGATLAAVLGVTMFLSACGGEGGYDIASTPPPMPAPTPTPTPTPTPIPPPVVTNTIGAALAPTPALTSGSYQAFGIASLRANGQISLHNLAPGDLHIEVAADAATKTYTLRFDPATFAFEPASGAPIGEIAYALGGLYGHEYSTTVTYSDGTTETVGGKKESVAREVSSVGGDPQGSALTSDTGKSYVSLGVWQWDLVPENQNPTVAFVYGERTVQAALPASGTATYTASDIRSPDGSYGNIELTADFGVQSMAAEVATGYWTYWRGGDDREISRQLSGSGPISATGDFEFNLVGTEWIDNSPITVPITGMLGGAFFGPDASQIGGYFHLPTAYPEDHATIVGAFIAVKN